MAPERDNISWMAFPGGNAIDKTYETAAVNNVVRILLVQLAVKTYSS